MLETFSGTGERSRAWHVRRRLPPSAFDGCCAAVGKNCVRGSARSTVRRQMLERVVRRIELVHDGQASRLKEVLNAWQSTDSQAHCQGAETCLSRVARKRDLIESYSHKPAAHLYEQSGAPDHRRLQRKQRSVWMKARLRRESVRDAGTRRAARRRVSNHPAVRAFGVIRIVGLDHQPNVS